MSSQYDLIYTQEDHLWSFKNLPGTIVRPRAKNHQIHLNYFTDLANRFTQNTLKQQYTDMLLKSYLKPIPSIPYEERAKLLYIYYAPDKRLRDLGNMSTIIMKFTEDALVKAGFIKDDNTNHIQNIHFSYGGLCGNKCSHVDLHIFKDN